MALALCSCAGKTLSPVQEAIVNEIKEKVSGEVSDFRFYTIGKVDSTTFRQEFEHRQKAFEARRDSDEKFLLKYTQEGKRKNAAIKQASYIKTVGILKGLDSLKRASSDILDDVAYYDYVFSGKATGAGMSIEFNETYVSITPDNVVMSMTADKKDLHKSLGRVIPGYLELMEGEEEPVE